MLILHFGMNLKKLNYLFISNNSLLFLLFVGFPHYICRPFKLKMTILLLLFHGQGGRGCSGGGIDRQILNRYIDVQIDGYVDGCGLSRP